MVPHGPMDSGEGHPVSTTCEDCGAALYERITPLCDACFDPTCPACESGAHAQEKIGAWPNGCPRYLCQWCGTEWSNTNETGQTA